MAILQIKRDNLTTRTRVEIRTIEERLNIRTDTADRAIVRDTTRAIDRLDRNRDIRATEGKRGLPIHIEKNTMIKNRINQTAINMKKM